MQTAGALDPFQLFVNRGNAVLDDASVSFDLGFAWSAQEPETTALAFKMGPGAHQPALLISKMGEFDLQPAFLRPGAASKYFEDQAGSIEHLGAPGPFQIALLDRAQLMIHNNQASILGPDQTAQFLHFT